jgi:hypothetical protein
MAKPIAKLLDPTEAVPRAWPKKALTDPGQPSK